MKGKVWKAMGRAENTLVRKCVRGEFTRRLKTKEARMRSLSVDLVSLVCLGVLGGESAAETSSDKCLAVQEPTFS